MRRKAGQRGGRTGGSAGLCVIEFEAIARRHGHRGSKGRLVFAALPILVALSGASASRPVLYPPVESKVVLLPGGKRELCGGRTKLSSTSADGRYVAVFQSLPSRPADGCAYRLKLRSGGRSFRVHDFSRWAALVWAPAGHTLALTDGIGSNVSDCFVVRPSKSGFSKASLTSVIERSPGRPRPPETPAWAHFYVQCKAWTGRSILAGAVFGHTDEARAHAFCHRFSYDVDSRRIVWTGSLTPEQALHVDC